MIDAKNIKEIKILFDIVTDGEDGQKGGLAMQIVEGLEVSKDMVLEIVSHLSAAIKDFFNKEIR